MNDDTISRQAAIEDIKECAQAAHSNHEWDMEQGYINAIECLEELPSAQPEIIRCKDCQYQWKGQNECETWNLCGYRSWLYTPTTDEHFCSYAERREDEH